MLARVPRGFFRVKGTSCACASLRHGVAAAMMHWQSAGMASTEGGGGWGDGACAGCMMPQHADIKMYLLFNVELYNVAGIGQSPQ